MNRNKILEEIVSNVSKFIVNYKLTNKKNPTNSNKMNIKKKPYQDVISNYQLVKNKIIVVVKRVVQFSQGVKDIDLGGGFCFPMYKIHTCGKQLCNKYIKKAAEMARGEDHFLSKEENLSPNPQHHIKVLHDHTCLWRPGVSLGTGGLRTDRQIP